MSVILQLRNLSTGRCLVAQGRPSQKGGAVVLRPCDPQDPEQVRSRNEGKKQIRFCFVLFYKCINCCLLWSVFVTDSEFNFLWILVVKLSRKFFFPRVLCVFVGVALRWRRSADSLWSSVFGRVWGQNLWPAQTDEVSRVRRVTAVEPRGETHTCYCYSSGLAAVLPLCLTFVFCLLRRSPTVYTRSQLDSVSLSLSRWGLRVTSSWQYVTLQTYSSGNWKPELKEDLLLRPQRTKRPL